MYLFLKMIHIGAVLVFLGNISLGIFWKSMADRTADPKIMAHTLRSIIRADRWFTIPGVIVLVVAVSVYGLLFWLLRKRFRRARQARVARPRVP